MGQKLTDTIVKTLPAPSKGNKITYDSEVRGFGCRVTAAGARAFILNYRTRGGRERRITIGSYPDWRVSAARQEAADLKKRIDVGEDPMTAVEADRNAKTMADLCDRFELEHLPKCRPSTRAEYLSHIDRRVRPWMKNLRVAEVAYSDIDDLHRKVTREGAPYAANRAVAVLSKMFSLALKWGWRDSNPCRGIEFNQEEKRERYLSGAELIALTEALAAHADQQAANIVRLLMLTGARRGEVLGVKWTELDLESGIWTKPSARTKQAKLHRVPLSAPARQLLAELQAQAEREAKKRSRDMSDFVFPGKGGVGHRVEIKHAWRKLCVAAKIVTVSTAKDGKVTVTPSARIHDLRHTFASTLASAGLSLPIIGQLLGHTQASTTHRYAHLLDDPLRAATERAGAILTGGPSADVIDIDEARR